MCCILQGQKCKGAELGRNNIITPYISKIPVDAVIPKYLYFYKFNLLTSSQFSWIIESCGYRSHAEI